MEEPPKCNIKKIIKLKTNWLVQFEKDSEIKDIKKIKYLNLNRYYMENYKTNVIVQCKNCQRFNHVASHCNGTKKSKIPRKEKNTEVIIKKLPDRTLKKSIGIELYCVNCKTHGQF